MRGLEKICTSTRPHEAFGLRVGFLPFVFVCLVALGPVGCNRTVPLENPRVSIMANSPQKVQTAVKQALVGRGWDILDEKPGSIKAEYGKRAGNIARIRVDYSKDSVAINHVDSQELLHGTDTEGREVIHRNYMRWIEYLERDIKRNLVG